MNVWINGVLGKFNGSFLTPGKSDDHLFGRLQKVNIGCSPVSSINGHKWVQDFLDSISNKRKERNNTHDRLVTVYGSRVSYLHLLENGSESVCVFVYERERER